MHRARPLEFENAASPVPAYRTTARPLSASHRTSLVLALQTQAARVATPGPWRASFSGCGIFKALFVVIVIA